MEMMVYKPTGFYWWEFENMRVGCGKQLIYC